MSEHINYEKLINDYARCAYQWTKDGYNFVDAIRRTLDDQFIRREDEALALAHYYAEGGLSWGDSLEWSDIDLMLFNDVMKRLVEIKEGE